MAVQGYLYALGGCGSEGEDLCSVERLSFDERRWEAVPPMAMGRDELAAVAVGGHVVVMGGSHLVWPVRKVLDSSECLELSTHRWQAGTGKV